MNEPYASAVGTTVLQLKEIPPRPADFDGALAIFGPKEGLNESQIRSTLEKVGKIESIEATPDMPQKWVVRFATHKLALEAKEQFGSMPELWAGLDTLYNERPYDERGWCKLVRSRTLLHTHTLHAHLELHFASTWADMSAQSLRMCHPNSLSLSPLLLHKHGD